MLSRWLPNLLQSTGNLVRGLTTYPRVSTSLLPKYNPSFHLPVSIGHRIKLGILDSPLPSNQIISECPKALIPLGDERRPVIIQDPTTPVEVKLAKLIVIRRHKMRKHKLKKLRIRMKFEWAKIRQKREMAKEKEFHAELMGKINEAEQFNPQDYVRQKIEKANEVLIPKLWKGKRLPEFVIKDLLAEKEKKANRIKEDKERRKKMNVNASDYKF